MRVSKAKFICCSEYCKAVLFLLNCMMRILKLDTCSRYFIIRVRGPLWSGLPCRQTSASSRSGVMIFPMCDNAKSLRARHEYVDVEYICEHSSKLVLTYVQYVALLLCSLKICQAGNLYSQMITEVGRKRNGNEGSYAEPYLT